MDVVSSAIVALQEPFAAGARGSCPARASLLFLRSELSFVSPLPARLATR